MIKAGHVNYAKHCRVFRAAQNVHTVVGLDVRNQDANCEERVQILRVGWEIGRFVIHQDLEKRKTHIQSCVKILSENRSFRKKSFLKRKIKRKN